MQGAHKAWKASVERESCCWLLSVSCRSVRSKHIGWASLPPRPTPYPDALLPILRADGLHGRRRRLRDQPKVGGSGGQDTGAVELQPAGQGAHECTAGGAFCCAEEQRAAGQHRHDAVPLLRSSHPTTTIAPQPTEHTPAHLWREVGHHGAAVPHAALGVLVSENLLRGRAWRRPNQVRFGKRRPAAGCGNEQASCEDVVKGGPWDGAVHRPACRGNRRRTCSAPPAGRYSSTATDCAP